MTLGVADPRIASAINEIFSITCQYTGVIPELLRGKIKQNKIELFLFDIHRSSSSFSKFS